MYNNKSKISEISDKLNISGGTIYKAIGELKNREHQRKYKVNENYFDIIDTEDKSYFLGLLYSDGCNNGSGFYVTLQGRDIDILYDFKKYIKYNGELKIIKNKTDSSENYISLNISSIKLSSKLSEIGCNKNKTINAIFPNIPDELINHFIRGLFDGDGSISIDKRNQFNFSIVGNSNIIKKVGDILNVKCKLNVKIRNPKRYKCDISIYGFGGNKQAKRVREFLYKNSTIYLKRKYLKFKQNDN